MASVRHLARLNVDDGTILVVAHVKMRRIVVGQVHRNDNSVELANLWHIFRFMVLSQLFTYPSVCVDDS